MLCLFFDIIIIIKIFCIKLRYHETQNYALLLVVLFGGRFFSQYVRQELKAFIFHLLGLIFIITHPRVFVLAAKGT